MSERSVFDKLTAWCYLVNAILAYPLLTS